MKQLLGWGVTSGAVSLWTEKIGSLAESRWVKLSVLSIYNPILSN